MAEKSRKKAVIRLRDSRGRFVKSGVIPNNPAPALVTRIKHRTSLKNIPPLVSFEVTNPVTYLKLWWRRVMLNEGIDFRFRIRPLTAIALMTIFALGGFGLGRITFPAESPIIKYIPQLAPTPTPDPWKETAFTGLLRQSGTRFYLVTSEAEAITLDVPENVNLSKYIGKRILAVGRYNRITGVLFVTDASDLEVLLQSAPIPTTSPSPSPTPETTNQEEVTIE
jgi:hypothetical protein